MLSQVAYFLFTAGSLRSAEEAGRYVEMYKTFETKPPDLIRERVNDDYLSHLQSLLTAVRGINKTDVLTLATNFGVSLSMACCERAILTLTRRNPPATQSIKAISSATAEELSMCPGFGETKARRLTDAFNTSFRPGETRDGRERAKARGMEIEAASAAAAAPRPPVAPQVAPEPAAPAVGAEEAAPTNSFHNELEGMTEEEQLQLALEMSVGVDIDLDDDE